MISNILSCEAQETVKPKPKCCSSWCGRIVSSAVALTKTCLKVWLVGALLFNPILGAVATPPPRAELVCVFDLFCNQENSNQADSCKAAYKEAEKRLIQNPAAFREGSARVLQDFKAIHAILAKGSSGRIGEFRQEPNILFEAFLDLPNNTRIQKAPVMLPTIQQSMIELAEDLEKIDGVNSDYLFMAAHVHKRLRLIQPFEKYNDEIARLYLNVILARYMGLQRPVIFHDQQRYETLSHHRVPFARWLKTEVLPSQDSLYKACTPS